MITVQRSLLPVLSLICLLSLTLYISRLSPSRLYYAILPASETPSIEVAEPLVVDYCLNGSVRSFGYLTTHPLTCVNNSRYVFAVISAPGHEAQREAIRQTWGGHARRLYNVPVMFLVGDTPDPRLQLALEDEDAHHGDVIQADFLDTYRNLSLKSLAMLRWTTAFCSDIRFLLKVDDDIFLNLESLVKTLDNLDDKRALYGLLAHEWKPITNNKSKWYLPPEEYNGTMFPDFVAGPTYIVGVEAIRPMLDSARNIPLIYLEDVYVTGLVAERANVTRKNLKGINNLRASLSQRKPFLNSHGHSPNELKVMWRRLFKRPRLKS